MQYLKVYNTISQDYIYYVSFNENSSFEIHFPFSPSMSNTGGTYGEAYYHIAVGVVRAIMRAIPDFFMEFSWCNIDRDLQSFGFKKQTEPTNIQKILYLNENNIIR